LLYVVLGENNGVLNYAFINYDFIFKDDDDEGIILVILIICITLYMNIFITLYISYINPYIFF